MDYLSTSCVCDFAFHNTAQRFFYVFTTFSAITLKDFVVDFGRRWTITIKLGNFQGFLVYESSLVFVRRSHFLFAYKTQAQAELQTTPNSSLAGRIKNIGKQFGKVVYYFFAQWGFLFSR